MSARHWVPAVIALAWATLAFWIGEGQLTPNRLFAVALSGLVLGGLVAARSGRRWLRRIATTAGVFGVGVLAAVAGAVSFTHAFNDCVRHGEHVRRALAAAHAAEGRYPDTLAALGPAVCGQRVLRPGLLEYRRSGDGYTLRFGDWLGEHRASEAQPFTAHK